nr:hypothetical protein [Streptomyces sp. WAC 01438]
MIFSAATNIPRPCSRTSSPRDDEFVHRGTQGGARHAELGAETALGGDGVAGAAGLDEFEDRVTDAFPLEHGA